MMNSNKKRQKNEATLKNPLKGTNTAIDLAAVEDDYEGLGNVCSACDCTGLIPANPDSAQVRDAYEDLYHYEPPKPERKN